MPYTAPSIYNPGTVDLLTLMRESKNGSAGLKRSLRPEVQSSQKDPIDLGDGVGSGAPGDAAGNGTSQSATVGNAAIGVVGNAVMGAVIGPIGMAVASALGIAPPSAMSVAVSAAQNAIAEANAISVNPSPEGIAAATQDSDPSVNGSVADAPPTSDSPSPVGGTGPADYAKGGIIRGKGTSTSDSISINASNGEYMLPAHVVEALGKPFLDHLISSIPNVLGGN